jgi:5-formyltetrahydrofolate cyclo-ligase
MVFHSIASLNNLKTGKYNIKEPLPQPNNNGDYEVVDTLIIPGLVFDRRGYRIGYGKGYYDRFLEQHSKKNNITAIGLGYEFQIFSGSITYEPHDFRLDALVTDKEVILTKLSGWR